MKSITGFPKVAVMIITLVVAASLCFLAWLTYYSVHTVELYQFTISKNLNYSLENNINAPGRLETDHILQQQAYTKLHSYIEKINFVWIGTLLVFATVLGSWLLFIIIIYQLVNTLENKLRREKMLTKEVEEARVLLEHKVIERTQQLTEKNVTLNATLSHLKDTQEQLIQTEKLTLLGQLAAGMAHEINNPLSYTLANLDVLQEHLKIISKLITLNDQLVNPTDTLALAELVEPIKQLMFDKKLVNIDKDLIPLCSESKEGLTRISKIIQAIKIYAQSAEEKKQFVDINACINGALEITWNKLKYKCTLKKELALLPKINGYPGQLEIMFSNLILNAIESIESKGEIIITSRLENHDIVVSIKDNGCGIEPENLSQIFTPFYSTKNKGGEKNLALGLGLGLPMVKNILQKHHGSIDVVSQKSYGSIFTVHLPVTTND